MLLITGQFILSKSVPWFKGTIHITGGFQPKLNQYNLNRIIIFIPPLNEQRTIVSKLKVLMKKLDEAEAQIDQSLETSKLLTKSVLADAFKE